MTPLRSVLGLLWLAGASAWMLPSPCMNLWRAWGYRSARSGAGNGNFAVMGTVKQLCFIASGIVAGLSAFWWEHSLLCLETAMTLLLLGVWLIYFEAPIDGLFDADDEEVLSDEEMLSLWYGGLNGVYARKFRGAGRWLVQLHGHTPAKFLRAWASDNPYLRASAYYIKAVLSLLSIIVVILLFTGRDIMVFADFWDENVVGYDWIDLVVHFVSYLAVMIPFFLYFFYFPGKEWRTHYRTLSRALSEGRDPDLSDRARMAEMRRTVLGWGVNSGYVRYDRDRGVWQLNAQKGRIIG